MTNSFNFIAPFYDLLAKLVFGKTLLESQIHFLSEINESDKVLILGGGTGKLLEKLPKCEQVHFVDASEKMISLAKKRYSNNDVNFIRADFLNCDFESTYNVIICPFFLDCFNEVNLKKAIEKTRMLGNRDAKLIVTDFQNGYGNSFLLGLMHAFFRILASLESKTLQNIHHQAQLSGFKLKEEKFFHRNMIFSRLYGNL